MINIIVIQFFNLEKAGAHFLNGFTDFYPSKWILLQKVSFN